MGLGCCVIKLAFASLAGRKFCASPGGRYLQKLFLHTFVNMQDCLSASELTRISRYGLSAIVLQLAFGVSIVIINFTHFRQLGWIPEGQIQWMAQHKNSDVKLLRF